MQLWDTAGKQLSASGYGAPGGDQVISAELTYGGAGSCQQATIRPINTSTRGRDTEWMLSLSEIGSVFRGIPDTIGDADGQLAQVGLMPSYRPRLDAPGTALGGVQAGEFETLASALQRELGDQPNADIGIRPDGSEVAGVPYGGGVYTLDSRAYDLRYLGAAYPDAVTDAVFDPGEGWRKYLYHRPTPTYALRKTASATADPAIVTKFDQLPVTPNTAPLPPVQNGTVTMSFNNILVLDGVARRYEEVDSTETQMLTDAGVYEFSLPADTDVKKVVGCTIKCPFFIEQIASRFTAAPVVSVPLTPPNNPFIPKDATDAETKEKINVLASAHDRLLTRMDSDRSMVTTPRSTRKPNELTLTVHLDWKGERISSKVINLAEAKAGLELAAEFRLEGDLKAGGQVRLRYELVEQDTGKFISLILYPLKVGVEYRTPNVDAVQMPAGWDKPFRTEPRFEFRLPGWHIPPLLIAGLPGGYSQMAAGSTVTWNRNECSTLITTAAWGYG